MTDTPDIWKIHLIYGTSESSGPRTEHFESRAEMERSLFDYMMAAAAGNRDKHQRAGERRIGFMVRAWRRAFCEPSESEKDDERRGIKKVQGLWHLEDGIWVEYEPVLHHPYVEVERKP